MRGSGGTEGGVGQFCIGMLMAGIGAWLFFDSVRVATDGAGWVSGLIHQGRGGHGPVETTSMGILFIPFFLGVFSLFVNTKQKWAWGLTWLGIGILTVEVLSRVRFYMNTKLTHFGLMLILFAAGCAFMFRSYRDQSQQQAESSPDDNSQQG